MCGPGLTELPECTVKRQSLKVSFFYTRLTDIVFVLSNMIYRYNYWYFMKDLLYYYKLASLYS